MTPRWAGLSRAPSSRRQGRWQARRRRDFPQAGPPLDHVEHMAFQAPEHPVFALVPVAGYPAPWLRAFQHEVEGLPARIGTGVKAGREGASPAEAVQSEAQGHGVARDDVRLRQRRGQVPRLEDFLREPVAAPRPEASLDGLGAHGKENPAAVGLIHGGTPWLVDNTRRELDGLEASARSRSKQGRVVLVVPVADVDFRASENFTGQGEGGRLDQPREPAEVAGAEADVWLAGEQDRGEPGPATVDVAHAEDSAGLGCRLHGLYSL